MGNALQENMAVFLGAVQRDLGAVWLQSSSTLGTAFVSAVIFFLSSFLVCRCLPSLRDKVGLGSGVAFVAAFIGFLTGHVTGNSRTAIAGDITPVLLAGVAGIFVLSLNHERLNTALAGIFVIAFGFTFFQGATLGSHHRQITTVQPSQVVVVPSTSTSLAPANAPTVDFGAIARQPRTTPRTLPMPANPVFPTIPNTFRPVYSWDNPIFFGSQQGNGQIFVVPQDSPHLNIGPIAPSGSN
jgi:hypothetical protein